MPSFQDIILEKEEELAVLTLNRPRKLNALTPNLIQELGTALKQLAQDDAVKVVILTGSGQKAFSAGVDLGAFAGVFKDTDRDNKDYNVKDILEAFPKPVIGAINGFAITGGFELALACDFMIASSNAKFSDTHARAGVMPSWGLSQKLCRIIGVGRARQMSFTGQYIDAQTASQWGLVNEVVSPDTLLARCKEIATLIASTQQHILIPYRQLIRDGYNKTLAEGMVIEEERARAQYAQMQVPDRETLRSQVQKTGRSLAQKAKL